MPDGKSTEGEGVSVLRTALTSAGRVMPAFWLLGWVTSNVCMCTNAAVMAARTDCMACAALCSTRSVCTYTFYQDFQMAYLDIEPCIVVAMWCHSVLVIASTYSYKQGVSINSSPQALMGRVP